jgi:rsbT co-antagonist protein RsbR
VSQRDAPSSDVEGMSLDELRRHVAALEAEVARKRDEAARIEETEQRFRGVIEATSDGVALAADGVVLDVNERFARLIGRPREEIIGQSKLAFCLPEHQVRIIEHMSSDNREAYEVTILRPDGSHLPVRLQGRAVLHQGGPARVVIAQDVHERERVEAALRRELVQAEVIRAHEAILNQLSTPLLPISDDVVVLPLIGALSAERAAQIVQALVEGVAASRARVAILDITGVSGAFGDVAEALPRAARAASLLGARVIVTGVGPDVARALVALGADLSGVMTSGTLQQGVASALAGGRGRGTERRPR